MWKCVCVMSVGLAVLGLVNAITIDNHLITTKNDCYERLALGQRLDARDVTRVLSARTVAECQAACSEEDQRCLSLSFGISPQGNGTCELSYAPIRETSDLQPIGTVRDPDFDLYIKKIDCKLNIPHPPSPPLHTPSYAVAVLDRPAGTGYEVQEPIPPPPRRRPPGNRPPDVFVFHGDRHSSYQNYYDVPRPLPLPYGPDRDRDWPPVPPEDDRFYGSHRPAYNDYYDDHLGYDDPRPYTPTRYQPNRPYRPAMPTEQHRPYGPTNDDNQLYSTHVKGRPSYTDDFQPYLDPQYPKKPPYRADKGTYRPPDPDNPNIYEDKGEWDRVGSNRPSGKPQGYEGRPQGPDRTSVQATPQGGTVTSIITQIVEPCYRRALAGKRIARSFIRRAVPCERVEDCQRECQEEKRFVCEGFNYRLDESGRGQGDCELTDLPLSRLDPSRDIIPDRDYDFYEKDRNSGPDCRPLPPARRPSGPGGPSWYPPPPHRRPPPPRPPPPPAAHHYYADRRKDVTGPGYYPPYHSPAPPRPHYSCTINCVPEHYPAPRPHYPPLPPPPSHPYPSYHPSRDRGHWGLPIYGHGAPGGHAAHYGHSAPGGHDVYNWSRAHFVPYRVGAVGGTRDWGRYGGSYGGGYTQHDGYSYWGFGQQEHHDTRRVYHLPAPPPLPPPRGGHYPPLPHTHEPPPPPPPRYPPSGHEHGHGHGHGHGNHIDYDGYQPGHSYPRGDDCSTRRGMGFRLHKGVVKKYYAVPNIHECEKLCYREKDFNCVSFSFRNSTDSTDPWTDSDETYKFDRTVEERVVNIHRYAITLSSPTDNCYLSDRPYNDLDFYTELEPDRDFDIYTMHRTQSCLVPVLEEESECFLRVRSGQRLDSSVVKDSMDAKSIVECQLECLTASRFTCRSFSYRWGPPHSGGAIDSCQLSDWPFAELDPRRDLVPEPGYEVYERGSYGHGCEENHFEVTGHHGHLGPGQHVGDGSAVPKHSDKICYVGYAKPARLTAEASKGALSVSSELDCKAECTRAREQSAFQCMSFSYLSSARNQPNCELSDVEQRDLRPELDYRRDPDAWLFAWDSLSPQCMALLEHAPGGHDPLDTWRVYSVSGWPCRRGSTCQENREAGFWSCELEGGDVGSWDYCCRPDHHCGYSQGFNYPWCYVGPSRDQWRTCSDRYYPYQQSHPAHEHQRRPPSSWHSERPYRPPYARPAPGPDPAHRPSLSEYEDKFQQQFLEPPRPGGLGRHWPVSYLHKETPPNATVSDGTTTTAPEERQHRKMDSAIDNVVQAIQAVDLNSTRYHAANQSDGADDVLFVRLPMPTSSARLTDDTTHPQLKNQTSDGFDELFLISPIARRNATTPKRELAAFPAVRRGTITRANRTARRRRLRPKNDLVQFIN